MKGSKRFSLGEADWKKLATSLVLAMISALLTWLAVVFVPFLEDIDAKWAAPLAALVMVSVNFLRKLLTDTRTRTVPLALAALLFFGGPSIFADDYQFEQQAEKSINQKAKSETTIAKVSDRKPLRKAAGAVAKVFRVRPFARLSQRKQRRSFRPKANARRPVRSAFRRLFQRRSRSGPLRRLVSRRKSRRSFSRLFSCRR